MHVLRCDNVKMLRCESLVVRFNSEIAKFSGPVAKGFGSSLFKHSLFCFTPSISSAGS